jgi:hypothetical protein
MLFVKKKAAIERKCKMSFVQINDLSIAIRTEDIVGVEVIGGDKGRWVLEVYIRSRDEPYKIFGEQLYLAKLYRALLSHLGNVTNIVPESSASKVLGEIEE